jgi:hypothetical protein
VPGAPISGLAFSENADLLVVVCALWRCGDQDDLAKKMLESIVAEDNGLYAHLAWKLLNSRPKASQ